MFAINRFRLTLAALAVTAGLTGASALLLPRASAATPTDVLRSITVSGQGEVLAAPDMATVNMGVQARSGTSQEAMGSASTVMQAVIGAIKAAGVNDEDIRTSNISLSPEYSTNRDPNTPPAVIGYRASNTVTVKVRDLGKLPAVLDGAVAAGANVANGISFGFNSDDSLKQQALQAAYRNAETKAKALATTMGVQVTGVLQVNENGISVPVPMPVKVGAPDAAGGMAPSVPVQAGQQAITGNVSAVFIIG